MDDGCEKLYLLQHSLGEFLASLSLRLLQADLLQPLSHALGQSSVVDSLQTSHVGKESADPHFSVDAALFRQVSNAILRIERRSSAENRDFARIRKQDGHDHADRSRLTC